MENNISSAHIFPGWAIIVGDLHELAHLAQNELRELHDERHMFSLAWTICCSSSSGATHILKAWAIHDGWASSWAVRGVNLNFFRVTVASIMLAILDSLGKSPRDLFIMQYPLLLCERSRFMHHYSLRSVRNGEGMMTRSMSPGRQKKRFCWLHSLGEGTWLWKKYN